MGEEKRLPRTDSGSGSIVRECRPHRKGGAEVCYYRGGTRIAAEYYDEEGRIISLVGTIPDGIVEEFHRNGAIRAVVPYRGGKPDGPSITYYPTGEVWEELHFRAGRLDGPLTMYRRDGSVWQEVRYRRGRLQGLSATYHDNGLLETEANYANGRIDGTIKTYDRTGIAVENGTCGGTVYFLRAGFPNGVEPAVDRDASFIIRLLDRIRKIWRIGWQRDRSI